MAKSCSERWARRWGMAAMPLSRPFAYAASRTFATRLLHTLLRGVSQDRLDLLGEEYFQYLLKPQLRRESAEKLITAVRNGEEIVLVSQLLEHVVRPMAHHFGISSFVSNRLEFRDGYATGRLLSPVGRPRGPLAWIASCTTDGRVTGRKLISQLGWDESCLERAKRSTARPAPPTGRAVAALGDVPRFKRLAVRETLANRHILLVGATGFIGKVWLVDLLENVPNIGKITLLIRRNRTTSAQRRFEKILEESPAFDTLQARHGRQLAAFLKQKVEVVEGDVSQPGLGMDEATQERLAKSLDLIVNSAGLTDFNPDLREALASNVDSAMHLLDFLRKSDHAGLMHLSTCYIVGMRDGRVAEELHDNYNPSQDVNFDAERDIESLHAMIRRIEELSENPE